MPVFERQNAQVSRRQGFILYENGPCESRVILQEPFLYSVKNPVFNDASTNEILFVIAELWKNNGEICRALGVGLISPGTCQTIKRQTQ